MLSVPDMLERYALDIRNQRRRIFNLLDVPSVTHSTGLPRFAILESRRSVQ